MRSRYDPYGVSRLKFIRNEWICWVVRVVFFVCNTRKVKFWSDKWCGDEPLRFHSLVFLILSFLRLLGCRMFGVL